MANVYTKLYTKLHSCVYMCNRTSLEIVYFFLLMRNKGQGCRSHCKFSLQIIPAKGSPSTYITKNMSLLRQAEDQKRGQICNMIGMIRMIVIKYSGSLGLFLWVSSCGQGLPETTFKRSK